MRSLTLTQPWCGLVASRLKPIENRPRSIIKREDLGKPFALHASREIDVPVYQRILEIAPELGAGLRWCESARNGKSNDFDLLPIDGEGPLWYRLSRITSAVIGVATIESAIVEFTRSDGSAYAVDLVTKQVADLGDQHRWFFGPFGYVLRDIRALETPVSCRGWQGFWTLPDDVAARVEEQLQCP